MAAAIDYLVVFGACFVVSALGNLTSSQFWIAFAVIWFLVEVPTVATRGRTIGHVLTSMRVTAAPSGGTPGWRRALVRWLGLVPGVVANPFGGNFLHDRWSDTTVVRDPDLTASVFPGHARARALEQFAEEHPRRYVARVALIAAGGYAFLFILAGVQLGAAAALIIHALHGGGAMAYFAAFVLAVLGLTTLTTLWLERSLPPGLPLVPDDAPKLFAVVEDLRIRLDAPRIDAVVVDPGAGAGMLQQARFGPFGPYRNVLVVGTTLLRSTSLGELRAVLAHEIAHLERRHGRSTTWIYRLRQAYPRLLEHLEHKGWTAIVAQVFLERYNPYFDLWSSALARMHEFEADRLAARIVGREISAAALLRIALLHRVLDERLEVPSDADDDEDVVDHHPSVTRRLAALGGGFIELPPVETTAAQALIPKELDEELVDMFQLIEFYEELEAAEPAEAEAAQAPTP